MILNPTQRTLYYNKDCKQEASLSGIVQPDTSPLTTGVVKMSTMNVVQVKKFIYKFTNICVYIYMYTSGAFC